MHSNDFDRMTARFANTTSRRQALKLMAGGILGGAAMTAGIKGVAAKPQRGGLPVEIIRTEDVLQAGNILYGGTGSVGEYFVITQFSHDGESLFASGNYYNTTTGEEDTFTTLVEQIAVDPVLQSGHESMKLASVSNGQMSDVSLAQNTGGGDCQILYLELAPLELDLLGLVITLPNALILDITAVPGAGNLLGNLLCAVAGLLDGNSPLSGLTGLLNNLLRSLGLA